MTALNGPSIVLHDDFEGARLGSGFISGDRVDIELRYDPPVTADWSTHDYRLHFTFGIENRDARARQLRVSVAGGDRAVLPDTAPLIYISNDPLQGYRPCEVTGATDEYQRYDFDLSLGPKETIYIANCLPRPLSLLSEMFDQLAEQGGAERIVFGRSVEGRELVAYRYGSRDKPVVLVASGIHPPEPDTLASEALMEQLNAGRWLQDFDFVIAPVMNPDGYHHGSQASNAAGINFYWDFRHKDPVRCPEAVSLYQLACRLVPIIYFDFHAYTFQWKKHASPYIKPLSRYRNEQVRATVTKMNAAILDKASAGKSVQGFVTYAPSTLGEKLTRKFNTITYAKYHIHLKDGEQNCRTHAVNAVDAACSTLTELGMADNQAVLCIPYGSVGKEPFGEMSRRAQVYWRGWLRRVLERIYRRVAPYIKRA